MSDYLKILKDLENYITKSIESQYPLKVSKLVQYDNVDNNTALVGIFKADNNKHYSFYIERKDGLVQLKSIF